MDEDKRYTDTDGLNTEYPDNNEQDTDVYGDTVPTAEGTEDSVQDNAGYADDTSNADQETAPDESVSSEEPVMEEESADTVFAENAGSEDFASSDEVSSDMTSDGEVSGQTVPPQDRPHDYDVDEPKFDTQTGERLDRPKKKYPGVILTLAVTAAAVGAFVYAVLPGKLPSLGNLEEDDVETEIHLAIASTESDETEAAAAVQTEAETSETETEAAAVLNKEAQTESELGAETETETETEKGSGTGKDSQAGKDKKDEKPEFKTEGIALSATLDVSDMVEEVMPGIVSVTCKNIRTVQDFFYGLQQIEQTDAGSGIIVDEDDDAFYIVTDAWVVEGADELTVGFSVSREATESLSDEDTLADGSVIGIDPETELAMLRVEKDGVNQVVRSLVKPAVIGDSDSIRVGERAIAIGNAMGYGLSVTEGIISALDRQMSSGAGVHSYIQTDASINYGNYGGALLNRDGEVIGINAGKISRDSGEGMGYAFPVNAAKDAISRMLGKDTQDAPEVKETEENKTEEKKEESSGKVMLQVAEPETEEAVPEAETEAASETEAQAAETEAAPETEAQAAETEAGPVAEMKAAETETEAAPEEELKAAETETEAETENRAELSVTQAGGGKLGVSVAEVSDEYSIIYRIPKGVYVVGVVDGAGADQAGIREDDVITSVGGKETPTVVKLKEVLSSTSAGDEVEVTYVRPDEDGDYSEDNAVTVTVTLQ